MGFPNRRRQGRGREKQPSLQPRVQQNIICICWCTYRSVFNYFLLNDIINDLGGQNQKTLCIFMFSIICQNTVITNTLYIITFLNIGSTSVAPPPAPPQPSAASSSSFWSPSQPPLPDSPPPPSNYPPPPPLPPGSPPPPPPPPDSDGEIMEVEMEMDDDNDGEPPAPGTEEDGSGRPPLPPGVASTKVCVFFWWVHRCCFLFLDAGLCINPSLLYFLSLEQVVESTGSLGKGQKRKASQLNKAITIGSSPILYTQPVASAGK